MRPIRASEIGTYLYCHRAWWYRQRGVEPQNTEELSAGTALHRRHGQKVFAAGVLRLAAFVLLLAACSVLAVYLTTLLLGS
jgi:CRISPR/Cas system-associated exonuclease Cas4 (RecB family)